MTRDATRDLAAVIEGSNLSILTKRVYLQHVRRWTDFAGVDPAAWTPELVRTFHRRLLKTSQPRSARVVAAGIRKAFRLAGLRHLAAVAPPEDPNPSRERTTVTLRPDAARRLLRACRGADLLTQRDRAAVLIGLATGILRRPQVELAFDPVYEGRDVVLLGAGTHRYAIAPALWEAIAPYRRALIDHGVRDGYLFRRVRRIGMVEDRRLVDSTLTEDGLYRALRERARGVGADVKPRVFRATFTSWAGSADPPLPVALIHDLSQGRCGTGTERRAPRIEDVTGAARAWEIVAEKLRSEIG